MTGDNEKTQPQELLEGIVPNEDEKFPTVAEQQKYWNDKEKAEEPQRDPKAVEMAEKWEANKPKPRRWSLARRRRFNDKKKMTQIMAPVKDAVEELGSEPPIRFCPSCGRNIERWLS